MDADSTKEAPLPLFTTIESRSQAVGLAATLKDPARTKPAVVISSAKDGPRINPQDVAALVGEEADIYLLRALDVTDELENNLPSDLGVYGGAARSYPPGDSWTRNARQSMVRLAYSDEDGAAAVKLIAMDITAMEDFHIPVKRPTLSIVREAPAQTPLRGHVSAVLGTGEIRANVGGSFVVPLDTMCVAPGIEAARLFPIGRFVEGFLVAGSLDISSMVYTAADIVDDAREDDLLLASVNSSKTVELFPGLIIKHRDAQNHPVGTVLTVRVDLVGRADGKSWKLTTVYGSDESEIRSSFPVLHGDDPWISLPGDMPAPQVHEKEEPAEPATEEPGILELWASMGEKIKTLVADKGHLTGTVKDLSEEIDELLEAQDNSVVAQRGVAPGGLELARAHEQVTRLNRDKIELLSASRLAIKDADDLAVENASLRRDKDRLQEAVRTERTRANRARQDARGDDGPEDLCGLFSDRDEQFKFEVMVEWARRIPASSKADHPLPEYAFLETFFDDVDTIQGIDRAKIVAVVVEVLTGLAEQQPSREMHRLRSGASGTSVHYEDQELGTMWRVSLQIKTASARRMHFWRGNDGLITFATVGTHDVF